MTDTQTQTPPQSQPYPHGSRSPEPSYAAHIRKLESALELILASEQGAAKAIAAEALGVPLVRTTTVVLTGTGAEVGG